MKKILRFALITPMVLMLILLAADYCRPQTPSGSAASVQTPAPLDPELEKKKQALFATVIDETKNLDERRAAADKLYQMDPTNEAAIRERNRIYDKLKERNEQKAARENEEKTKSQKKQQCKRLAMRERLQSWLGICPEPKSN